MPRHVVNLGTGVTQDIEFTPEEVAQNAIDAAAALARAEQNIAEEQRKTGILADTTRQEFLTALRTSTLAQIKAFAVNKINADAINSTAAVDLATARQCLVRIDACAHRIETGMATLLTLIALDNRR